MSDDRCCECSECRKAGVRRVAVAPLGQTLHGRELEDYWQAREAFQAVLAKVKGTALGAAAQKLVGE